MKTKIKNILDKKGRHVWSLSPEATAYEALELMAEKDISSVLIVEDDKPIGIFSERDYARKIILKGRSSKETHVCVVMSSPLLMIEADRTLVDAMTLMRMKHIRHLPVIEDGKLAGVVTVRDVLNLLVSEHEATIHDLEGFIVGSYS